MEFEKLHDWNLDFSTARNLQTKLHNRLDLTTLLSDVKIAAGCDVSQNLGSNVFTSAVVIMSYPEFEILETVTSTIEVDFPYIPGLLSFREMPPLLESWQKVKNVPDLVFCDGSGYIHPRKFGLACHLGLWLNLTVIGCAKNLLCGETVMPDEDKGCISDVILDGMIVGKSVRTRTGVKPMYVSPGNGIDIEQSAHFVLESCLKYRIPEPIRAAHKAANQARKGVNVV